MVHGDLNPRDNRMTEACAALIDLDESRVDIPDLDLALPFNAAGLTGYDYDIACQASSAREAAVCWGEDYAKGRLAEVQAL